MDKYHITSERYELLFLYENIYGIFRPREFIRDYRKSKYYDLIKTLHFDGDSLEDILKDLAFFVRAGRIELKVNDVVAIKINGFLTCYRYCGLPCNLQGEHPEFIKVDNFLVDEKERYISDIHKEYFNEAFPGTSICHVYRKSNHPDDYYLYTVTAKSSDGTYCCWSSWNSLTESLNHGHYGLKTEQNCIDILQDLFNDITDEPDQYGMQQNVYSNDDEEEKQQIGIKESNIIPINKHRGR